LLAETALGESSGNGRGSGIEREIKESAGEGRLQIDDWRRHLSRREWNGHRSCWRNNYVRNYTKSAAGVRHVCSGMNVRNLNRRAENQQERTAKSESDLPRVPNALFCLLIVHHFNYNSPSAPEA
jgi:hypothetical protein